MKKIQILDIFHQPTQQDIPTHWCVQFIEEGKVFVDYMYYESYTEAIEFAVKHGYED